MPRQRARETAGFKVEKSKLERNAELREGNAELRRATRPACHGPAGARQWAKLCSHGPACEGVRGGLLDGRSLVSSAAVAIGQPEQADAGPAGRYDDLQGHW